MKNPIEEVDLDVSTNTDESRVATLMIWRCTRYGWEERYYHTSDTFPDFARRRRFVRMVAMVAALGKREAPNGTSS